ncbi:MAG: hypothetical protein H7263_15805, partial [Candidatus Sericytochromatia bacterium]|nr:hypothetical protein [Candidatus Sericytochromatia bacterium]
MKKLIILIPLIISTFFVQPSFSEDIPTDQNVLLNQLQNQLQKASPKELEAATSDPDLEILMKVMGMVQNKGYKEAVPILEDLIKNPKGKGLTPQSKTMIKNLIDVMKVMGNEYQDG